ncbi:MAG: alkaline shock response membrane anchor protein AmaP [Candidatus Aureabacteria bacterium]|nr:alkaline shock response membrane anchor protein AmaP [Candidatus Auribacterota bacterium]
MRFLSGLIKFMYTIAALIAGAFLIAVWLHFGVSEEQVANIVKNIFGSLKLGFYSGLCGIGLILSALCVLFSFVSRKKTPRSIAYSNPEGEVTISVQTIQDLVEKVSFEFEEVKSISSSVKTSKRGITIVLKLLIWAGTNVPSVAHQIQKVIKEKAQAILGVDNISAVEVNIVKIVPVKTNIKEERNIFEEDSSANEI